MTRIVRLRRITLHFSHMGLTLGRTFIGDPVFVEWSGVGEGSGGLNVGFGNHAGAANIAAHPFPDYL